MKVAALLLLALLLLGCEEEPPAGEPVEPDVTDTPVDVDPNVEEVEPGATPDAPTPPPGEGDIRGEQPEGTGPIAPPGEEDALQEPPGAVDPGDVIDTGPGQEPDGGGGAN